MITDKQKSLLELYNDEQKLLLLLYYDRGVLKKEIRSYEVSLWTLQDEFITVLKWSDVEQKGRIEDPIMTLRTDGTLTFKFSIPMYYRVYNHPDPNYANAGKLIENPNWYNTLNGNLMVGLRKIKVIFNKEEIVTEEDRTHNVFEFVITDINESHDGDILTCEIEASGLAFLELGKIGYKINLSLETVELDEKAWSEGPNSSDLSQKPAATVDYWCEKIGLIKWTNDANRNPLAWYYKVEMNWDSFSYVGSNALRSSDKVYEDPYTVAWDANLNPISTENAKEKERIISADKSNIYNITQTIAETFEIFCRYEYGYDENYHIISKTVVFYNNFVNEDFESITYPYSATRISRTMDSKDVTTKLYVLDADNASTIAGISSMMNSPANPTKEDYILNFDYMYKTGAITKEAYDSVREYEKSIKAKNEDIIRLLLKLAVYERRLPEYKGKLTTYTNSIALDKELIITNQGLKLSLQNRYGTETSNYLLVRDGANAKYWRIPESGEIEFTQRDLGIDASTIHAYTMRCGKLLMHEVNITPLFDEMNQVIGVKITDMKELAREKNIDWDEVFKTKYDPTVSDPNAPESDGYTPLGYKGNVDLSNRKIVPLSSIPADWGVDPQPGGYATLLSTTETVKFGLTWYDVIFTPIKADGTVLSQDEAYDYFDLIVESSTSITDLMARDKKSEKLFLHYMEIPDENTHNNTWETELHNRQEEWDKIRAANNWFGYDANPHNILFPAIDLSDPAQVLTYYPALEESQELVTDLFLTYSYDPVLYYDEIIKMWQIKLAQDQENKRMYDDKVNLLTTRIENAKARIQVHVDEKQNIIKEFERMMGPALREGYWLPDNYNDYGEHKHLSTNEMPYSDNDVEIFWDENNFVEEETAYYEASIFNKDTNSEGLKKEYYPCIRLDRLFINGIPTNLDEYSVVWWANKNTNFLDDAAHWNSIKDLLIFSVGSLALFRYIRNGNEDIPVLMLVGAKSLPEDLLQRLTTPTEGHARLELYSVKVEDDTRKVIISHGSEGGQQPLAIGDNWILIPSGSSSGPKMLYPRIKFTSLNIKTDTTNLNINYASNPLKIGEHYSSSIQYDNSNEDLAIPAFYITIKPELFMKYGTGRTWEINYVLSNADTAIYLDALKVSKENAIPKVSYDIAVNAVNEELSHDLHKKLAQIVMINDTDLKFENTFGYISELELHLDKVYEDNIKIQNYKTKFEDLFSTIIAQTEAMKLSSASFDSAISGDTALSEDGLMQSIAKNKDIFDAYLEAHLDSSKVVRDRLTELFKEAGEVLGSAGLALGSLKALNDKNASTLASFVRNVGQEITVETFRQPNRPNTFKLGDVWVKTDENNLEVARYLAMKGFDTLTSEEAASETGGFVRTFDATLASIKGAALDIDAAEGIIDIKAENQINIRSGKNISIAANANVDIFGNESVNIGGTTINIGSTSKNGKCGGINLIASSYSTVGGKTGDETLAKVLISPKKIEMGAADILMRGASKILMLTSRGSPTNTSAIEISPDTGVWIGSGLGVRLFSGNVSYTTDADGKLVRDDNFKVNGASVELNSEHLILGYANNKSNNATAIELTEYHMILASGGKLDYPAWQTEHLYSVGDHVAYKGENYTCTATHTSTTEWDSTKWSAIGITGTALGLIGAKFTKESIGFATGSGANINAILMNDKGITIGSGSIDVTLPTTGNNGNNLRASTGSYVRIGSSGIELGSLADLYINTDNFKLLTHSRASTEYPNNEYIDGNTILALGAGLNTNGITGRESIADLRALAERTENPVDIRLVVNQDGAYFRGNIYANNGVFNGTVYASGGSFTGAVHASSFELTNNTAAADFNTAVSNSTAISGINIAIGNTTKSTVLIYYLSASQTAPPVPKTEVTAASTQALDTWALSYPEYPVDNSTTYYYYSCILSKTEEGTVSWTVPTRDYGVTSAAQAASIAKITRDTFNTNGLLSNYSWGGTTWPVALTSTGNMLIGANTGLYFVKPSATTVNNGAALVIDDSGIAMTGSTISLSADSTISITSGATVNINSSNFTIKSNPASGENYFYVGDSNLTPSKYIKYTQDGTLEIKGNIIATSFSLSSTATTEFNSAVSNAIGSGDFGRNGIGWNQWPLNSGNYYVSLTATSDNLDVKGILIGMSDSANLTLHLIVPWSATSSKTIVDISKNGIFFDANLIEEIWPDGGVQFTRNGLWQDNNTRFFDTNANDYVKGNYLYYNDKIYYFDSNGYKLTDDTIYEGTRLKYFYFNSNGEFISPHITINSDGIEFGGASLKLNGRELWGSDIWGRDNIIIMNPNATGDDIWRKTVSSIELHMGIGTGSEKHDWVLIKPFYNAKISYNKTTFPHKSASSGQEIPLITVTKNSINDSFGNGAESYTYTFILDIYNDTNTAINITAITIRVQIGDVYYTFNNSGTPHGTITDFPRALVAKTVNENLKIELTSNVNLSDDTAYSMTWHATFSFTGGSYITFADGTTERFKSFVGETNATNSRVPCTVYYYP